MAALFRNSSHLKQWLLSPHENYHHQKVDPSVANGDTKTDSQTVLVVPVVANQKPSVVCHPGDLELLSSQQISYLHIYFCQVIVSVCRRVRLRQQVIGTSIVFFKRFNVKVGMVGSVHPVLLAATCIYVAAKAEECPIHGKIVIYEMQNHFGHSLLQELGIPSLNVAMLNEFELYLLEVLNFSTIVYHPAKFLNKLVSEKILNLEKSILTTTWFIINDSYKSDAFLLYPPYLIALAAVFFACGMNSSKSSTDDSATSPTTNGQVTDETGSTSTSTSPPRLNNSSNPQHQQQQQQPHDYYVKWFAQLNVNLKHLIEISKLFLDMYSSCKELEDLQEREEKFPDSEKTIYSLIRKITEHGYELS